MILSQDKILRAPSISLFPKKPDIPSGHDTGVEESYFLNAHCLFHTPCITTSKGTEINFHRCSNCFSSYNIKMVKPSFMG